MTGWRSQSRLCRAKASPAPTQAVRVRNAEIVLVAGWAAKAKANSYGRHDELERSDKAPDEECRPRARSDRYVPACRPGRLIGYRHTVIAARLPSRLAVVGV